MQALAQIFHFRKEREINMRTVLNRKSFVVISIVLSGYARVYTPQQKTGTDEDCAKSVKDMDNQPELVSPRSIILPHGPNGLPALKISGHHIGVRAQKPTYTKKSELLCALADEKRTRAKC